MKAVLWLDVVATSHVLARVTSIMAKRRFEVVTMEISAPAGGQRRITVEVGVADDLDLQRLVKFLNQSPDVVKVARPTDMRSGAVQP
jgi:acetolactate synthase I/III small subunit